MTEWNEETRKTVQRLELFQRYIAAECAKSPPLPGSDPARDFLDKADAVAAALEEIERLKRASRTRPDYDFRCDECGAPHWLDTSIPSEVWNQIMPDGGALCMLCIDDKMDEQGLTCEAEFYFVGKRLSGKRYGTPKATQGEAERAERLEQRVKELEEALRRKKP